MKQAIFKPEWYSSPGCFQKEWDQLYSKVWLYAGLTARIKTENSYFTFRLFDKEVVVHRLQGQVRAYLNVCPHRGGPLVLDTDGVGAPVCKYHGWAFRSGQELTGLTNVEWFNHGGGNEGCSRALRELKVSVVGPVIFVSFAETPIELEQQYPVEVLEVLAGYGEVSDFALSIFNSPINWKLNIENVKDFLHPYYVHPESFKPILNYEEKPPTRMVHSGSSRPGVYTQPVDLKSLSFLQRSNLKNPTPWWRSNIKITQLENTYQNIFLFPNTNFCSVSGAHYVIQQYMPKSPDDFDYILTAALPEKTVKFDSSVLLTTIIRMERSVIYEDDLILKKVHKNLKSGLPADHFAHGDYEDVIMNQMLFLRDHVYC
jgi:phenylpropionate dioxygenase-like ring-hydroxylating dioxygenase large terminal subunit